MTLPDFIVGGAPRAGTTYLAEALDRHPRIRMARPLVPEPKVLVREESDEVYRRRYATLFGPPDDALLGEKTSYYLESEAVCRRIRRVVPDARLIFLVREPVARAYSNYLWTRQNGLEPLTFAEAVEREGRRPSPLPADQEYARPFDYLTRGAYGRFASVYLAAFGRERVLFLLYERIADDAAGLLCEAQGFLGVDPEPASRLDPGQVNALREPGPPLDARLAARLRARMRGEVLAFADLTGLDVARWGY